VEPGRKDPGVVDYEQVTFPKEIRKLAKEPVDDRLRNGRDHHQA
jgi:hypothetical protein